MWAGKSPSPASMDHKSLKFRIILGQSTYSELTDSPR